MLFFTRSRHQCLNCESQISPLWAYLLHWNALLARQTPQNPPERAWAWQGTDLCFSQICVKIKLLAVCWLVDDVGCAPYIQKHLIYDLISHCVCWHSVNTFRSALFPINELWMQRYNDGHSAGWSIKFTLLFNIMLGRNLLCGEIHFALWLLCSQHCCSTVKCSLFQIPASVLFLLQQSLYALALGS